MLWLGDRVAGGDHPHADAQGDPGSVNKYIVNYGGEADAAGPDALTMSDNTFVNERHPGVALRNVTPVVATVTGNRFLGVETIVEGPAALAGNDSGPFATFVVPPAGAFLALAPQALAAYTAAGAPAGGLPQYAGIVGDSGLAVLDGQIFVASRTQGIAGLDLTAGISTFYFGPQGIEALGSDGDRLLAAVFGRNEVLAYSADGDLLETIALQTALDLGIAGLDSDGTRLFVGSFTDGDVYVFYMTGVLDFVIDTGLSTGWLSALAWDAFDGSILVGAGFGDGSVRRFDINGALLATYQLPPGFGGLASASEAAGPGPIPTATPEPAAASLLGLALLAAAFARARPGARNATRFPRPAAGGVA